VVISVHSFMDQDRKTMTERVLRAMAHPAVDILAHPTGPDHQSARALRARRGGRARGGPELGVAVELNANPNRLDLDDVHVHRAKELGVPVVISTDAHGRRGADDMRFGVDQARRGWLERRRRAQHQLPHRLRDLAPRRDA
jgi:DNA polymerase (family X)